MIVRRLLLALLLVQIAIGCSSATDQKGTSVAWDLRQPTTTRELGSTSDVDITQEAGPGQLLDVDIQLPGATATGRYPLVSASALPLEVNAGPGPLPINQLQLLDVDVDSLDGLQAIVDRFEHDWGFSVDGRSKIDAYIIEARTKIAASGGIKIVDWPTTPAAGFGGNDHGDVHPALTVVVKEGGFSTYTSLSWTPVAT